MTQTTTQVPDQTEVADLAERYGARWNAQDLEAIVAMHAPDGIFHLHVPGAEPAEDEAPPPGRRPFGRRARRPDGPRHEATRGQRLVTRARDARQRGASAVAGALPRAARAMIWLGVLVLAFALFVVVFGAMRHTARQERLEAAFRSRVAAGHADRPNWRPLPGQALATISIPAIDLFEVVVQDTTPDLLKGGPGHLLGTSLPGQRGNVILLGRRVTDGGPFGDLDALTKGDRITAVTPSGAFVYAVEQVVRVAPGADEAFRPTDDARMTLITSASSLVAQDRTVVVALLEGAPAPSTGEPVIQQRGPELGTTGDPDAAIQVLGWSGALILALLIWTRERRRVRSRWYRSVIATPVVLILLFFLFENAENLLPGSI